MSPNRQTDINFMHSYYEPCVNGVLSFYLELTPHRTENQATPHQPCDYEASLHWSIGELSHEHLRIYLCESYIKRNSEHSITEEGDKGMCEQLFGFALLSL